MPLPQETQFLYIQSPMISRLHVFLLSITTLAPMCLLPGYAGVTTAELNEKTIAQCGVRLGNQNYSAFLTLEQGSYL